MKITNDKDKLFGPLDCKAFKQHEDESRMFLVFSHRLTEIQIDDAKKNLNVKEFIYLPRNLQSVWGSIPPELDNIQDMLHSFKEWIVSNADNRDFILIQGDFGATYELVRYCKELGFRAVYSTTKRIAKETIMEDGKTEIIRLFEHVRFRGY